MVYREMRECYAEWALHIIGVDVFLPINSCGVKRERGV